MEISQEKIERFWSLIDKSGGNDACWLWKGRDKNYGCWSASGKIMGAHRWAYQLTYGDIPEGLLVCHHCDNPPCCNPSHLFIGTHKDNTRDMVKKGRGRRIDGVYKEKEITEKTQSAALRHKLYHQRIGTTEDYKTDKIRPLHLMDIISGNAIQCEFEAEVILLDTGNVLITKTGFRKQSSWKTEAKRQRVIFKKGTE